MLSNINKKIFEERLEQLKSNRENTLKNIKSYENDLLKIDSIKNESYYLSINKILNNHKKYLNQLNDMIKVLDNQDIDYFKSQKLVIATSNASKLSEIKRIIPDIESLPFAKDIEEVDGTIDEVILHKAKDARYQNHIPVGTTILVEDTIIRNEDTGKDITDIKWNVDSLEEGTNVKWITSLALNDGINIYVFRGRQEGVVTRERGNEGFAFDPYFIPNELYIPFKDSFTLNGIQYSKLYPNNTLAELEKNGIKDIFSARAKALKYLSEFKLEYIIPLVSIKDWEGKYQNEKEFKINYNDCVFNFDNFNHFKRFMNEEKIELTYNNEEEIKKMIKENKDIYISESPYDRDINGLKTIIIADSEGSLEHYLEQSFNDI